MLYSLKKESIVKSFPTLQFETVDKFQWLWSPVLRSHTGRAILTNNIFFADCAFLVCLKCLSSWLMKPKYTLAFIIVSTLPHSFIYFKENFQLVMLLKMLHNCITTICTLQNARNSFYLTYSRLHTDRHIIIKILQVLCDIICVSMKGAAIYTITRMNIINFCYSVQTAHLFCSVYQCCINPYDWWLL